jgi:hypothetical protein
MKCIVLVFPDLSLEQENLLKLLGERGACVAMEASQSSSFLQCLEALINSSSHLAVQKDGEKNFSVASASVAGHHINPDRGGSKECASIGSEDLAGEARRKGSVEQHVSVVQSERGTACRGSSLGAAVGTSVQGAGTNIII